MSLRPTLLTFRCRRLPEDATPGTSAVSSASHLHKLLPSREVPPAVDDSCQRTRFRMSAAGRSAPVASNHLANGEDKVAKDKPKKFKFKRLKIQILTVVDSQKNEIGSVRIEPNEIAWRPAGESHWYSLPMRDFGKLAVARGMKGETGK